MTDNRKQNTTYIVLGVHRSGTSLCTNILNELGVFLGPSDDLLPVNESNQKGYFEHKEIVDINDAIFEALGGTWDHPPIMPKGWEDSPEIVHIKDRIQRFVLRMESSSVVWGMKDPRLCLTISLWKKFLPAHTKYIVMYRSAEESFNSFLKMHSYDKAIALQFPILWVKSFLNIFASVEKEGHVIVSYNRFIYATEQEIQKMCKVDELGFLQKQFEQNKEKVLNAVSGELHHQKGGNISTERLAILDDHNITDVLFRDAEKVFSKILTLYEQDVTDFNSKHFVLEQCNEDLRKKIEEVDRENDSLSEMKKVLTYEIDNFQQIISKQQDAITESVRSHDALLAQIEKQQQSFLEKLGALQGALLHKSELLAQTKQELVQMSEQYEKSLRDRKQIVSKLTQDHQKAVQIKDKHIAEQSGQMVSLETTIKHLTHLSEARLEQIRIMESSKFWGIRARYLGVKWALRNPLKFIKKYIWKSVPSYQQIKWALRNPLKFIKKYTAWSQKQKVDFSYQPMFKGMIGKNEIAVVLHLYYPDLWGEIREKLDTIPYDFQLVVTLTHGQDYSKVLKKIKKYKRGVKFYYFDNKGFDVIPFLKALKELKKETKYILKIHTKKSTHSEEGTAKAWRDSLMRYVLPSRQEVDLILHNLEYTDIGMIGGDMILDDSQNYEKNIEFLYEYTGEPVTRFNWIAGTMFWVRADILRCFSDDFIDFIEDKQPSGYVTNGTIAHGVERYFGKKVYDAGKIISLLPQQRYGTDYISTLPQNSKVVAEKDLHIFFHICCVNNYKDIVQELVDYVMHSGLYAKVVTIHCVLLGNPDKKFLKWMQKFSKIEIVFQDEDMQKVEYPTLERLQDFCRTHDAYVMYMHTKGVFYQSDTSDWWRRRLADKTIQEHGSCIAFLNQGFDVAGCGWKEHPVKKGDPKPPYHTWSHSHFSGNFWWADSSYIKKLPLITDIERQYFKEEALKTREGLFKYRIMCEMWLGMSNSIKVGVNGDLNKEYGLVGHMKPKPNMLFVSHDNSLTGAPKMLFEVAEEARKRFPEHNVIVVASDIAQTHKDKAFDFSDINALMYGQLVEYVERDCDEDIALLIEKYTPEFVYINTATMHAWVRHVIDLDIPYVWHIHEKHEAMRESMELLGSQYLDKVDSSKVITVSDSCKNDLEELGIKNPSVINPFIDLVAIHNRKTIVQQIPEGLDITKPFILSIGAFAHSKGVDVFIETARLLPDMQFVWIGNLYDYGLSFDMPDNIFHIKETDNPYYFMSMCSLFVLCSRSESFSLVTLEAICLNKPLVSFSENIALVDLIDSLGDVIEGAPNVHKLKSYIEDFDFNKKSLTRMTGRFIDESYQKDSVLNKIFDVIQHARNSSASEVGQSFDRYVSQIYKPYHRSPMVEMRQDKFRLMCYNLTPYLPHDIPFIDRHANKKTLLIETQRHPHFEFLIKNTIQKMGDGWGHMVFCSQDNYSMIKDACDAISGDIEIHILDREVRSRNDYNNLLLDYSFWSNINCEKVLVYQSDTFLFKSFEDTFSQWDYIGASWATRRSDGSIEQLQKLDEVFGLEHPLYVGNGGLSIRSVSMMKDITGNSKILNRYRHNNIFEGFDITPEDVVFSVEAQKNDAYNVPPLEVCDAFAFEYYHNDFAFGCHQPFSYMPFYNINFKQRFLNELGYNNR